MTVFKWILSAVAGYLLGSVSSAVIMSHLVGHLDVRNYGSGNAGATNMARIFGMGVGVATLFLDGLKTAGAMLLGRLIGGEEGFLIAGGMCLLGHCFPVWFGFRGGKGVAVGAAMGLMLNWKILAMLVALFFLIFALTRRVSACSVLCAAAFVPFEIIAGVRGTAALVIGALSSLCVIIMHRENIKRLLRGEEKKFQWRRSSQKGTSREE